MVVMEVLAIIMEMVEVVDILEVVEVQQHLLLLEVVLVVHHIFQDMMDVFLF